MKGSLTVEASVILPLLLFLLGMAMRGGIELYKEVKETSVLIEQEEQMNTVKSFYQWKILGDIVKYEN